MIFSDKTCFFAALADMTKIGLTSRQQTRKKEKKWQNMTRETLILQLALIGIYSIFMGDKAVADNGAEPGAIKNSETIRVALFAEADCTDQKSREAVFKLLSNCEDMHIDKVSSATVRTSHFTQNYDVLILPGGTGSGQANAVGEEAANAISAAVKDGKGIVAICAGSYYLAKGGNEAGKALDIINTKNHDGEHWARGECFIAVEVLTKDDPHSSRTMWYENGPLFKPAEIAELPKYTPLVKYVTDMAAPDAPGGQMAGRDAVIAAPYGTGRLVLFGPHPELSPGLHHWLVSSVRWAAGKTSSASAAISAEAVLGE